MKRRSEKLLPAGAMSLGLALQSNLAVEFGMTDEQVAVQTLWAMIISSVCMVVGETPLATR